VTLRRLATSCWIWPLLCVACSRPPETKTETQVPSQPVTHGATADTYSAAREWIARHRRHGWELLQSVTTPDKVLFLEQREWHTEIETFAKTAAGHAFNHGSPGTADGLDATRRLMLFNPVELGDADAPTFPIYEATFYNEKAFRHIRAEKLYVDGRAVELRTKKRREITEFPAGAMVLKSFWRPVPKTSAAERRAYVGIWRWRKQHTEDTAETIEEAAWPKLSGTDPVCVVSEMPDMGCRIARDHFFTAIAANLTGQECISGKCPAQVEDQQAMVLIGLHIVAKDQPDWFWATFWWKGVARTNGDAWTCDNAQRPNGLKTGVRGNYSMDVGTSFRLPKPAIVEEMATCGTPGDIRIMNVGNHDDEYYATYNPFVEGVKSLGRKSSCIDCHSRATTTSDLSRRGEIPPVAEINAAYPDLRMFENHIRTDYLWTVTRYMGATKNSTYGTN
jgi:hypothetical protein